MIAAQCLYKIKDDGASESICPEGIQSTITFTWQWLFQIDWFQSVPNWGKDKPAVPTFDPRRQVWSMERTVGGKKAKPVHSCTERCVHSRIIRLLPRFPKDIAKELPNIWIEDERHWLQKVRVVRTLELKKLRTPDRFISNLFLNVFSFWLQQWRGIARSWLQQCSIKSLLTHPVTECWPFV